jgi:hypothetical protein
MAGLKGQSRIPRTLDPRERRNAAHLATDAEAMFGGALSVVNGVITLVLGTNPGLDQTSGLVVLLKTTGSGLLLNGPGLYVDNTVYVPYTGATATVNLGAHDFTTTGVVSASQVRTPEIKTDGTTPTDLTITTGAAKTLVLGTSVYADLWTAIDATRVVGTASTVMLGNIRELVFSNNDQADFPSIELQHDYKQGTDLYVHLHIATRGTNASAYNVRYTIEYSIAAVNGVFGGPTTLDVETTIAGGTAALTHKYITMGTISGAGLVIGSQIKYRLVRIAAAVNDAPAANNPFVLQVGIHRQIDTLGSRLEATK